MKNISTALVWLIGIVAIFILIVKSGVRNSIPLPILVLYAWSFLVYKSQESKEKT